MKKSQEFEMTPVALAAFRMQALIDLMAALGDKYDVATHNFRHGTQLLDPKGYARSLRASLDKSHPLANERVVMPLVERYAAEQNELRRREICKFMERVDIDRGTAEVAKLAAHLRDAPEADPLDVAAIRSMLWQIKRKLFGHYSVEYPLLLVLVGGQGYGKNVTYEKISKPLKDLCGGGIQLKQLVNSFNEIMFSECYFMPIQEMSTSVDYNAESLKTLVTEASFQYRRPGTAVHSAMPNKCTFMGFSNYPLSEIIKDTTGARRWWMIKVPDQEINDSQKARINALDFELMWASVDGYDARNPRQPVLQQMSEVQMKVRARSTMEDFYEQCVDVFADIDNPKEIVVQKEVLFAHVEKYCSMAGVKKPSLKAIVDFFYNRGLAIKPDNRPQFFGFKIVQ